MKNSIIPYFLLICIFFGCSESSKYEINHRPEIIALIVEKDSIEVRSKTTIRCIAKDIDGDSLRYIWNTFADSIENKDSTIVWHAGGQAAYFSIECKVVDDKGAEDSETIYLNVFDYDTLYLPIVTLNEKWHECLNVMERGVSAFRDQNTWGDFWQENVHCHDSLGNLASAPLINFDSLSVATVYYGRGPSGCQNQVTLIESAYFLKDTVFVNINQINGFELGPCLSEVSPIHLVAIENKAVPIKFIGYIPM